MIEVTLKDLLEAGCHFGHQSRRWNPAMAEYIYGEKDKVHIFDLVKTKAGLDAAAAFVKTTASQGGTILFVGTKRQAADFVKTEAIRVGMPYVSERWMGGMLTNFGQLGKSVRRLKDLKEKRAAGELKKYTKYEQLQIDRDIAKLEKFLGGVADMGKIPQAMFVVDTHKEDVAVKEGIRAGVAVIGLVDTNADPKGIDFVIPANDDAVKSVELVVKAIADAIGSVQKSASSVGVEEKPQDDKPKKSRKLKKNVEVSS